MENKLRNYYDSWHMIVKNQCYGASATKWTNIAQVWWAYHKSQGSDNKM